MSDKMGLMAFADYASNDVAYYEHMLKEGEIESLNILEMTPEEVMDIRLPDIPDDEPEPGLDEIRSILEENRAAITASMNKAEKTDAEIAREEKELSDKMNGNTKTGEQAETVPEDDTTETLADRIRKYNFSEEQIAEAMVGIEHGLPEEKVLAYFTPDTPPSKMRILRRLAEVSVGIKKEMNA